MRGTITIGDKSVDMVANGATPFLYKKVFRRDFLASTQSDNMDVFGELGYIMAMQASRPLSELVNDLTYDDFLAWVSEFEALDLTMQADKIFALYKSQTKTTSVSKKKK